MKRLAYLQFFKSHDCKLFGNNRALAWQEQSAIGSGVVTVWRAQTFISNITVRKLCAEDRSIGRLSFAS
jgi:hypothetical protein